MPHTWPQAWARLGGGGSPGLRPDVFGWSVVARPCALVAAREGGDHFL
ncbi:hypothetical protein [Marichromatium bheemlicum]|uniref:Uncharacterized protein n=1 Tax=Marichromatium bheemlicum TaxID=365339 RepID=A0ABX1I878_9GAMM|nr:hypothetical protein [Marichromatium bheemlicum]NKN33428.1 hypothetical protein [Marichromatium bheemlicum]